MSILTQLVLQLTESVCAQNLTRGPVVDLGYGKFEGAYDPKWESVQP
jgi:hypothetical protein